jgi:hypothetical protein
MRYSLLHQSRYNLSSLRFADLFSLCGTSRALFGVSCLPQRAAHSLLGCPALVLWARLLALSWRHRPLNARLLGTGGGRALIN